MKAIIYTFCLLVLFVCCSSPKNLVVAPCTTQESSSTYSKATQIDQSLNQLVKEGVPGVVITVYSNEGWWSSSAGLANIENKVNMQPCHLQYLQSVTKTYMAVGILKLYEQGKINLDSSLTDYLPEKYSRNITDAKKISVRMLLNHTSGIPEYNSVSNYVTTLLQHPDHVFYPEDYLKYIKGKPLDFAPGSKYSYRNTNYVILALIADAITGDHAKFLPQSIFKPLGLTNTFYRNEPGYLSYPNLVNSYWDRHSDGIVENVSLLQRNNVASMVGDDGIVATPGDAVKFLQGLMEGKLLSGSSMKEMKSWVKDSKGNLLYGLGLDYAEFVGQVGFGHSGGGLGAGCQLYYFPDKDVYVFIGINLGTVTDSPIHKNAERTLEKIYTILLN